MKKKLFMITLAVCLIVLSIAGTSLAYFTDVEKASNVFTAGNVDIQLTYGNKTADADAENILDAIIIETRAYPGQTYKCDAAIKNVGNEAAYVGAIITVTNTNGMSSTVLTAETVMNLFKNLQKTDYTVKYAVGTNELKIYVVKDAALAAKNGDTVDSAIIFDDIAIPVAWDNAEMKAFNTTEVVVQAYATQQVGFTSAEEALKAAFGSNNSGAWAGYATATTPSTNG